jgi:hypothetical protein
MFTGAHWSFKVLIEVFTEQTGVSYNSCKVCTEIADWSFKVLIEVFTRIEWSLKCLAQVFTKKKKKKKN